MKIEDGFLESVWSCGPILPPSLGSLICLRKLLRRQRREEEEDEIDYDDLLLGDDDDDH